jgi:hypothetical protein
MIVARAIAALAAPEAADESSKEVVQPSGASEAGDPDFEKEQVRRWMQLYAEEATKYEITVGEDERKLELQRELVLRWSNPARGNGTTHGACFVWTRDGRPEAFASIFSYVPTRSRTQDKRWVCHAFNSLSLEPMVARRSGETFWRPQPVTEPQPIPDASEPADSRRLRLVEMRNLARQFRARCGPADNQRELRLIPQPVYRHQDPSTDVLDGALFSFVMGTDPEVLLLIEARKTPGGSRWCYSLARHSSIPLRAFYQGDEIWSRQGVRPRGPTQPFLSVHGISIRDKYIR